MQSNSSGNPTMNNVNNINALNHINTNSSMSQNSNINNITEKNSVNSKNDKLDNTNVDTLVKKLNETKDINLKMGVVDKLIKLCGSAQLKGIILDNLIKGLVNSI